MAKKSEPTGALILSETGCFWAKENSPSLNLTWFGRNIGIKYRNMFHFSKIRNLDTKIENQFLIQIIRFTNYTFAHEGVQNFTMNQHKWSGQITQFPLKIRFKFI